MYKNKKGGIIGIIVTTIILILLVVLTNVENSNLSYVENVANKLVTPIQNGLTYIKNKVNNNNSFFEDISKLKEENEKLQEKNNKLEETLREFETMKARRTSRTCYRCYRHNCESTDNNR